MISKFSVKKPFTVLVAVILVLVLGTVSVTRMTPDLLPEMSFPYIVLVTPYVGAAPEEVETTVTKPLEQNLAALDDLKQVTSVSSESVSVVYLTFEDTVNVDRAMLDIQQVVTRLKGDWPEAVGTTNMLELSTDLIPTVVAAVHYKDMDPIDLSGFVSDKLIPALEGTNGVASVNATGLVVEEVQIELNKEKIDKLNRRLYDSMDEAAQEAFDKIDEGQQKIDEGRQELENAKAELEEGQQNLNYGSYSAREGFENAEEKLNQSRQELTDAIAMMESKRAELVAQRDSVQNQRQALSALQESVTLLEGRKATLEASIAETRAREDMTPEEKAAALLDLQRELDAVNQGLAVVNSQLTQYGLSMDQVSEMMAQMQQLDDGIALLDKNLAEAKAGLAQVEGGQQELDKQRNEVYNQIWNAQKKIDDGRQQIEDGAVELENSQQQLDDALAQAKDQLAAAKEAADLHGVLTKELVAQLVQAQNFEMPAGFVSDGDVSWIVNVGDKVKGVEALENVAILSLGLDGLDVVRLVDVADVRIVDNSATTYARINGENGVLLTFNRQSAYATATVADTIDAKFRELEDQYPGLSFVSLMDQGDYIHMAMSALRGHHERDLHGGSRHRDRHAGGQLHRGHREHLPPAVRGHGAQGGRHPGGPGGHGGHHRLHVDHHLRVRAHHLRPRHDQADLHGHDPDHRLFPHGQPDRGPHRDPRHGPGPAAAEGEAHEQPGQEAHGGLRTDGPLHVAPSGPGPAAGLRAAGGLGLVLPAAGL